MSIILDDLAARLDTLTKAVLSQPLARIGCSKVTIRPLTLRGKPFFQLEYQQGQKVVHHNVTKSALPELFAQELDGLYLQAVLCTETETRQYVRKANGGYKCTAKGTAQRAAAPKAHDRKKEYLLAEGENIPALVDLGVFTQDFRIVRAKYDKYKQINRFIELVDDAFRATERQEITILDFGCGKSYLTFILYYYFTVKRGVKATILGYDLKEDVVEHCNEVAQRYGYDGLRFVVSDVTRDTLADTHVDMVVTLHACDTTTDYALWYAVEKGVEHIFSVPCCQHEINATIHKGGDFDLLLRHGLLQERFSALLTDAIRAAVLEDMGYTVDVIEFIDFAHSPKNLMLRCVKDRRAGEKNLRTAKELAERYGFRQTLLALAEKNAGAPRE
ncbi:SAM-dependent methyltransferase [Oscillibacter valericigenes]|nr:SAM-dependent methyltransferase [Oscillibacter valericigenes]